MLKNDTEYLRVVAVGDLSKARGLQNKNRLIARDPVYAARHKNAPPSLDFILVHLYYTTLSNKRVTFHSALAGFLLSHGCDL